MRNRSSILTFLGLAVVVIIGGLLAGYYYKGSSPSAPTHQTAQNPAPTQPVAPTITPAPKRQAVTATDFTAAGAPDIEISEVKGAAIPRKTVPDQAGLDTQAQPPPADNTPPPDSTDSSGAATSPTTSDTTPGADTTTPDNSGDTSGTDNNADTTNPAADNTAAQPTPPAGPLYRVQAGSFINEANAKILASALRRRGYSAIAVPGTEDGKPVFKVQVGAYHSKAMADQTATDLQKSGYPAYVSH
ncbi:MAG TPA: SPOR domain-containing protein [Capsulimonadaceae bacterium]|nr:SPOR domain-containing protein [Capsulimonadaceae bacterium]